MHPDDSRIVLGTMDFGTRVAPDRAFAILGSFVVVGGAGSTRRTVTPSGPTPVASAAPVSTSSARGSGPGAADAVPGVRRSVTVT